MTQKILNGDEALAYGALSSGIKLITSYPGSPSSGTVETLIDLAEKHDIYVEWSSNEKVAMEMGIGASIAGRRALVCVKSVGMNAMIDPLMALNLTPVNGGLVILRGDDPAFTALDLPRDDRGDPCHALTPQSVKLVFGVPPARLLARRAESVVIA